MSVVITNRCDVVLHEVHVKTSDNTISAFIAKHLPNVPQRIRRGGHYQKNGLEYQRIYVSLNKPENVDEFMKKRDFTFNGQPLRVTRNLPKTCDLYDHSVTGLGITIDRAIEDGQVVKKLNQYDLVKHFEKFGKIRASQWMNEEQTEALFEFDDYDSVDQIIISESSHKIKWNKIYVRKVWTVNDLITDVRSHIIHVTDLPVHVTSEELSSAFGVPVTVILLYPYFNVEQSHMIDDTRLSSEAWIKNVGDERTVRRLAKEKDGTLMRAHKIRCEAILEKINMAELCDKFENGTCPYTQECHYKHFMCPEPDTCDNAFCRFCHRAQRPIKSVYRREARSRRSGYRVKISNLPLNVTYEDLVKRLKINGTFSRYLHLQPNETISNGSKSAYLTHQYSENKVRKLIYQWHDTPFSPLVLQKIKCQLEVDQEFFDWNDSIAPTPSIRISQCASSVFHHHGSTSNRSQHSSRRTPISKANSTGKCTPPKSNHANFPPLLTPNTIARKKKTTNFKSSKSATPCRQSPSDISNFTSEWIWTSEIFSNDGYYRDEFYWVHSESDTKRDAVMKIYSTQTDEKAEVRAKRERVALRHLSGIPNIPELMVSNLDKPKDNQKCNERWAIMKHIDNETLSDFIKQTKPNLQQSLKITRQLLSIIKQIHSRNTVHRDIQPKNILIKESDVDNTLNLTLINFDFAWIDKCNSKCFVDDINEQLGNDFYRMPQFEIQPNESGKNPDNQQFRCSPTIDTSGVCAILFWLITGHEPREWQDICGIATHKLQEHSKIIDKKIIEATAFSTEKRTYAQLKRQLTLTFDRGFADPSHQWPVDELDFQLQFMLALLLNVGNNRDYFPALQNTNNIMSPSIISLEDPVVYMVLLIDRFKKQFSEHYSKCIRWSTAEKSRWCIKDQQIENYESLTFSHRAQNISIDVAWFVTIKSEQQYTVCLRIIANNKNVIELPLNIWKKTKQTADLDVYLMDVEMELKIIINVLCRMVPISNN